jgi:ferredoxin
MGIVGHVLTEGNLMKVTVDPDRCQGHAQCWEICPEVFGLDEEGHSVVLVGEVPAGLEAKASRARRQLPRACHHRGLSRYRPATRLR